METNGNGYFKTHTLTTGVVIKIRYVPQLMASKVHRIYPDPMPPIRAVQSRIPGVMPVDEFDFQDPNYQLEKQKALRKRVDAVNDFSWNYAIVGVEPPEDDGWKAETGLELFMPGVAWREGPVGRRLDWIEYVLLANPTDMTAVAKLVSEASRAVTEEEVEKTEESFRSEAGREPSGKAKGKR